METWEVVAMIGSVVALFSIAVALVVHRVLRRRAQIFPAGYAQDAPAYSRMLAMYEEAARREREQMNRLL